MISVIVNFFNMQREARRSLHALSRMYQRGIDNLQYEVIATDNGSSQPLTEEFVRSFGPEFRYRFHATDSTSPVGAVNGACREARGDWIVVLIDGAHIITPGVLALASKAFSIFAHPFIATWAFHLGPKAQNDSILEGYTAQVEDEMLDKCRWWEDGYRLFTVASDEGDDSFGWFGCLFETACFAMRRHDYLALGGLEEKFQSRGGGLMNLDFFQRVASRNDLDYVMLVGEATFHQVHGGTASNAPRDKHPWDEFHAEYVRIRGKPLTRVARRPFFMGSIPPQAQQTALRSSQSGLSWWIENATPPTGSAPR